jgi:hypothetical protein
MTSTSKVGIKAGVLNFWLAHWSIFIILFLTYLGSLWEKSYASHAIQTAGAVGIVVFLPLFRLEKNIWLYIAAFLLFSISSVPLYDAGHLAKIFGLARMPEYPAWMFAVSVQGAVLSFVCLLLYVLVFRFWCGFALVIKVPLCIFCLIAALYPAFDVFWLILGFSGLLGQL